MTSGKRDRGSHTGSGSRRTFIRNAAAATFVLASSDLIKMSVMSTTEDKMPSEMPWYSRVTRWGQTNITEKDPPAYDITWWRKHWKTTEIQGVIINAGGIVAYYPSKVPFHRQAQYLAGRDLFGELCSAAHEDGLAVFARMDSNRAHEEFYKSHPDWFSVDSEGKPYKAGELYITCVNSSYYNEHIPSILTEIYNLYQPEGFTDNSWSGMGRDSICYCENCRKSFYIKTGKELPAGKNWNDTSYRLWIRWNYDRRLEIWDLNNRTTKKAGGADCIWSGMNSGTVSGQARSFRDIKEICRRADIIMLDSQARSDAGGFQQNADTGKLIHGLLGWDKLIPESMAMYQAGRPTFRLAAKPVAEARMWMTEGIAGGIQPWWHYVSASHEDRRIYKTAVPVFDWHRINEQYLINRTPVATVGVIWSQQNTDFYGRDESELMTDLPWRGIIQALIRARIPYLPINADHIERDKGKLSVIILPDLGVMTDNQIAAVRRFVQGGGGVIATGESSLYNEWGDRLSDYGLADIFGAHVTSQAESDLRKEAGETYHTYLRLLPEMRSNFDGPETNMKLQPGAVRHPILKGFDETDIISYGGLLNPLKRDSGTEVLMTFIPQFPIYPPETAWMREPVTDIPGLIINTIRGSGRVAFLHLVNLTSTGTWRQPLDEYIPVGPANVKIRLPESVQGKKLRLLVAKKELPVTTEKGWAMFTVNSITDHEVVVIN